MLPLYNRLGMDRRILACAASMAAGVNFLPVCSWRLGKGEERRLGLDNRGRGDVRRVLDQAQLALRRPGRTWINLTLTLALIVGMTAGKL